MSGINFKIEGFDDKKNSDALRRVLMRSMFKMEELAINNAPVDRGHLRNNITLFPHILANKYILESKASYSAAIEYGTRPFYAPIKPLSDWQVES